MSQTGPSHAPEEEASEENACPACGSTGIKTLCQGADRLFGTTKDVFHVVECRNCRLIRLYPWPHPREIRNYYPDSYWFDPGSGAADQLADVWRRFVLRDHVNFVQRALTDSGLSGPVLDVGCGGGLLLRELNLPSGRAIGLDFSIDAARVAWTTNGVPAACGALPRSPFRRASFAAVTMFHVLEHLYDPAAYLEAAHRLLMPEGRLIVQVPNAACWQFLLFGEAWNGLDIPRHLIDFKEQDLVQLLEYSGFEVLRRKHFSLRDNPAGLASTLAPSLDPMARRIRKVPETERERLVKDLVYFSIVLAAIPFALLEAACRAGSTIMLEARPRA